MENLYEEYDRLKKDYEACKTMSRHIASDLFTDRERDDLSRYMVELEEKMRLCDEFIQKQAKPNEVVSKLEARSRILNKVMEDGSEKLMSIFIAHHHELQTEIRREDESARAVVKRLSR